MTKKQPKGKQVKQETVIAYKGFGPDWKCRDFQYEVGETYEHSGRVAACESGFHACENPLDVLSYYGPTECRFALVDLSGEMSRHGRDSKIASARITVKAEIGLPQIISDGITYLMGLCRDTFEMKASADDVQAASGDASQLAASGNDSQLAASGYASHLAASGDASKLAASGYASKLAASGDASKLAASGYASQLAASGNDSQLAASGDASQLAASGDASKLAASGNASHLAASGDASKLAASGNDSICMAAGLSGIAKVGANGAIALAWFDGKRKRIAVGYVGEDGIKADTWYRAENGKLVEVA